MSGFVGFFTSGTPEASRPLLQRMVQKITHDASYTSGTLEAKDLRLAVGWSMDKEAFAHSTPFWNENRDVCLIFCGEEFSDEGQSDALRNRGHSIGTDA